MKTRLDTYNNSWYNPGGGLKRILWYFTNLIFFRSSLIPLFSFKRFLLRAFGAEIGKSVVIKPRVNIKYPWYLKIGDHCWIGEDVWIDNLALISIGNHVCLSQGCLLICGSHDYTKSSFDLKVGTIILEDGVWIGCKAVVAMNTVCGEHSILSVNSVAPKVMEPFGIYQGNPAIMIRNRKILE